MSKVIEIDKHQALFTQDILSLYEIPVGISYIPSLVCGMCHAFFRPHNSVCYLSNYQKWITLNLMIWYFGLQVKNKIEIFAIENGKDLKVQDYPSCVNAVTAIQDDYKWVAFEMSGAPMPPIKHHVLISAFKQLFNCEWGKKPDNPKVCPNGQCIHRDKFKNKKKCRNTLGNCAEQKGANQILNQGLISNLNELDFSLALRPRTMEVIPYCCNCTTIFPQLK